MGRPDQEGIRSGIKNGEITNKVKGSGQECPLHKSFIRLALRVPITNVHCPCTKVTLIIF
jgi:hypothetical protein